ncbi:MAG: porin family protein [Agarilytica sp.]
MHFREKSLATRDIFKASILLLASLFFVNTSWADKDKGVYVGAGINFVNVGVLDPFANEVNFKTGDLFVGYKYNPYLGVELRYGASLQDETISVEDENGFDSSVTATISEYTSVYYRPELSNEIAKLYLLLGQTSLKTSLEIDSDVSTIETAESGLSYGFGFGLWLDEKMNLNFEYKVLVTTSADSFTGTTLNADYRF